MNFNGKATRVLALQNTLLIALVLITSCGTLPPLGVPILYVRVYNEEGAPVPLANVSLNGGGHRSITDSYGRANIALTDLHAERNIEVSHALYLSESLRVEDDFAYITLRSRGNYLEESYELAKQGLSLEAFNLLDGLEGFEAQNYREEFYVASLHYLIGNYSESRKMLISMKNSNEYKRQLLQLVNERMREQGGRYAKAHIK